MLNRFLNRYAMEINQDSRTNTLVVSYAMLLFLINWCIVSFCPDVMNLEFEFIGSLLNTSELVIPSLARFRSYSDFPFSSQIAYLFSVIMILPGGRIAAAYMKPTPAKFLLEHPVVCFIWVATLFILLLAYFIAWYGPISSSNAVKTLHNEVGISIAQSKFSFSFWTALFSAGISLFLWAVLMAFRIGRERLANSK